MYSELADVAGDFPGRTPPGLAGRALDIEQHVWRLSQDDLELLSEVLSAAPNWRQTPAILQAALEAETEQSLIGAAAPPDCPAGLPNGILDWFIARDVAQGLDFAQIFAPDDLVVVTVIAGEGGGGTVGPHPIKIALQVAYEGAQTAALVLEQIYFINDECETNAHRALLRQHDWDIKQQLLTVKAAQRQILKLLLTPQGRHKIDPDVLTCTGDDCPQVLDCSGGECRFPIKPGRSRASRRR